MAQVKGQNWGVFGTMNTGKTYQTMKIAIWLQELTGKPIIIYDHSANDSYKDYNLVVSLERLKSPLPNNSIVKVQTEEFDEFCDICRKNVRESIIVLDDSGIYFRGNIEEGREKFIKATKNNFNDIFYQTHSIREVGPALLNNLQMIVLKEMAEKNIPDKLGCKDKIEILHYEVCKENDKRPIGELYSYRIYNILSNLVYKEDKNGNLVEFNGRDYFKKYEKQNKYK